MSASPSNGIGKASKRRLTYNHESNSVKRNVASAFKRTPSTYSGVTTSFMNAQENPAPTAPVLDENNFPPLPTPLPLLSSINSIPKKSKRMQAIHASNDSLSSSNNPFSSAPALKKKKKTMSCESLEQDSKVSSQSQPEAPKTNTSSVLKTSKRAFIHKNGSKQSLTDEAAKKFNSTEEEELNLAEDLNVSSSQPTQKRKRRKHSTKSKSSLPPPRVVSLSIKSIFAKQKKQSGCGDSGEDHQNYVSPGVFPTKKELEYFERWTTLSSTERFTRGNAAYVELVPIKILFKDLDKFKEKPVLHYHMAKLIDIFIRKNIQKVGGDLKKTEYWMQLDSPGYQEKDGWFTKHKTHAQVGGFIIMNTIAKHMQSNDAIKLDDGFAVCMNIFKDAPKKRMAGRGVVSHYETSEDENETDDSMISDKEEEEENEMQESTETDNEEEEGEEDVGVEPVAPETRIKIARGQLKLEKAFIEKMFGVSRVRGSTHCLPKALALGRLWSDRQRTKDLKQKEKMGKTWRNATRKDKEGTIENQLKMAKELLREAKMPDDQIEHTQKDLETLALHLKEYTIKLYVCGDGDTVPREETIYNENARGFIGILYHRGHFDYVNHQKGFKISRYCYKCCTWGDKNHSRTCKAKCWNCGSVKCAGEGHENIECPDCNVIFKSPKCYDNHKKSQSGHSKPNCDKYFYCKDCHRYDQKNRSSGKKHVCGETKFCMICLEKTAVGHKCTHAIPTKEDKEKRKSKQKRWVHVVYDMECIVVESGTLNEKDERGVKHVPNMICAKLMCNDCRGVDGCSFCGDYMTYSYENCPPDAKQRNPILKQFIKFLLEDPRLDGAQVIAHNGGGYDHPMLIGAMITYIGANGPNPKVITNGMKIIHAEVQNKKRTLYFLDSLQFLQMGLGKMPSAFGLVGEAKGQFPYLYNHPDHYNITIPTLPPMEYYSYKTKSASSKKEFEKWYKENYNTPFNLHVEMEKYCRSDVRILVQALAKFIEMCENAFDGWHPLLNGCTLASYVMFVLKNIYIQPGDIGVIPENGYGGGNNSVAALKYIQWLENQNPQLKLQYMLRGGEKKITINEKKKYYADAYNEETNEIYEIHGCVYHGCPKCYPIADQISPVNPGVRVGDLLASTRQREEDLRKAGYIVHSIWECEINAELKKNKKMNQFFKLCKHTHRLKPRDALYGGRTQAYRSRVQATKNRSLHYLDYTSLYPWLNAMGTAYPRGNPIVLTEGFPSTDGPLKLRGLAFCDVLPDPEAPVGFLPEKLHGKLMFLLCRTCGHDQNISGQCTHHKVSERYLTGVWCTDELNLAISKGYKVLKYHEIWYWPEEEWVTGGFFAGYIKPLLKLKHESTGWPKADMSDEEKEDYITKIFENDGVALDPANIKVNKALRSLAKLFLNSAWGKFAQNPIKTETKIIYKNDSIALTKFFRDSRYEANAMIEFGNKLFLSRTPKRECLKPTDTFTNLMIGAQTTCGGRIRLHEAMEMAGYHNMIYCDTDSVIFFATRDEDPLKSLKGEQLGYLTNEIPEGHELVAVVVMAPKVYGLKMQDENGKFSYAVKVKGVTLDCEAAKTITFDSMDKAMKDFISTGHAEALIVKQTTFLRGDHALDGLWTFSFDKKLTPRMDKGHYDSEGVITPFGSLPKGTKLIDDYPFYN